MSVTRYVTWSLHTKSRSGLQAMLKRVRPSLLQWHPASFVGPHES